MGYTIPTSEPTEFVAGDLLSWYKDLSDYPASSWTLTYALQLEGAGAQKSLTASASGDRHLISVAAATTAAYTAGIYHWQSYVTSGTERHAIERGRMTVVANFAASSTTIDARSHIKKVLDALEATILGKASVDQMAFSIGGRSLSRMSPTELREWYAAYRVMYADETRAEQVARGLGNRGKVRTRFIG